MWQKRTLAEQITTFAAYYREATRLRSLYADRITLLVGFETEWIHDGNSLPLITSLLLQYSFDMFVGSIHHVRGIPIDFSRADYERARAMVGGTDASIAVAYLDEQLEMLEALRPPIVGHFDLIRLLSDDPNRSLRELGDEVWRRVERNVRIIIEYGGVVELNSAAIRKGMKEPYPGRDICEMILSLGGRFALSDDSHGVEQVGQNFDKVLDFAAQVGIERLHYLDVELLPSIGVVERKVVTRDMLVAETRLAFGEI